MVFPDHLDAGAAVLGDSVDVGTLHHTQADVCMPQTVRGPRLALSVDTKFFLVENSFRELALPLGENQVRRLARVPSRKRILDESSWMNFAYHRRLIN